MADTVVTIANDETSAPDNSAEPEFIDLYSGTALGAADAEAVMLRSHAHLVVFVGTEGSGKSTVLASIYERLNQGPFAGFLFAGSRTLLGFEEVCHLNRIASGGDQPDTQRTQLTDQAKYYHLALRGVGSPLGRRDILLSAMSGELFRMAKDSQEDAERLTFLRRADVIVVLVDGERLANIVQRTSAQADAAAILGSLLDAGMVSPRCQIEIVFSKLDRIQAAGPTALDFLNKAQEKFEGKFRTRVPHLLFRQIAARPSISDQPESGKGGLDDAFMSWMNVLQPDSGAEQEPAPSRGQREFSKYGWRYFERKGKKP